MGIGHSTAGRSHRKPWTLRRTDGYRSKLAREACRTFKEMLSGWSLQNLHCLLVELEASLALRELTASADLARPPAGDLRADLWTLYRQRRCWDVCFSFDGKLYPLHRCIVQSRSVRLNALIQGHGTATTPISLQLDHDLHVDHDLLESFFHFLYTGVPKAPDQDTCHFDALLSYFGVANRWSADMESLCRRAQDQGDMVVLFTGSPDDQISTTMAFESDDQPLARWRLHATVLAARSPFFCSLVEKRRNESTTPDSLMEVYFDESVIPRHYAPVIFKAMYRDTVDLSLVSQAAKGRRRQSCLNEVKAIASGTCLQSPLEEATDIYQIARFLEYPLLMQGCEEAIASRIDFDTLRVLYTWSCEPYGSCYVRRCCVAFLAEHFEQAAGRPDFLQLEETLLVEALKLDFVQATELEILAAVLKWGEYQLIRRLEEQEPNLIAGTSHSISRKGLRRCAKTDSLLGELLADLLKLIRVDYVLPRNHPIFADALHRNLVDVTRTGRPWSWTSAVLARPRIYLPFYAMAKRAFLKRMTANPEERQSLIDHKPAPYREMDGVDLINCCLNTAMAGGKDKTTEQFDESAMDMAGQDPTAQRAISCGCSYHLRTTLEQLRLRRMREMSGEQEE